MTEEPTTTIPTSTLLPIISMLENDPEVISTQRSHQKIALLNAFYQTIQKEEDVGAEK